MTKKLWSGRVLSRYILFQLPAWVVFILVLLVIRHFISIPTWVMILLFFVWVLKDAVMYPFVWRAYDEQKADSLVGMQGMVTESLDPSGYVMVRGELWKAEVIDEDRPVHKGEAVRVSGSRGLTLTVRPDTESNRE